MPTNLHHKHSALTATVLDPEVDVGIRETRLSDVLPDLGTPWWRVRHLRVLNICLLVPITTGSSVGFDLGLMNGLQALPQWHEYFNSPKGATLGALANGLMFGMVLGLSAVAWLNDRYGRRTSLQLGAAIIIIGSALQAASQNYAMFLVSRIVIGFGSITETVSGPVLITELAYPPHRPVLTATFFPAWYIGAFLSAWITYGSYGLTSTWAWRLPSLLQASIPLLQLLGSIFVPESPRFLVSVGEEDAAHAVFNQYHVGKNPEHAGLVDFEMTEVKAAIAQDQASRSISYMEFFRSKENRRRLFVLIFLACTTQLAGNGLVSYYLNLILNSIGITDPRRQLTINGALMAYNFGISVITAFLVGRLRRRTNLLLGLGAMFIFYIIWTVLSAINEARKFQQTSLAQGVLAMIFLYYFAYNLAFTMPYTYITEFLPYQLRAKGLTLFTATFSLTLIVNGFVNPVAMEAIGWRYYIVFCCLLLVEFVVVWFAFPETCGHTLEGTTSAAKER